MYKPYEIGFSLGHSHGLSLLPFQLNTSWSIPKQQGYKDGYWSGKRAMYNVVVRKKGK